MELRYILNVSSQYILLFSRYSLDSSCSCKVELELLIALMQVVIPLSLQRRVEGLLQEHIDRTQLSSGKADSVLDGTKSCEMVEEVNMDENPDTFLDGSVMEKLLQRRSLRMRNMQRVWQVSNHVLFLFLQNKSECTGF